jgi:hypothetical protein
VTGAFFSALTLTLLVIVSVRGGIWFGEFVERQVARLVNVWNRRPKP